MSSEGLPVNNVVGTSVDLGARSVQDAANSASSSQNADSAAASADAAWKFSRVAQGAAEESSSAVSDAEAAAAAASASAQNATITANLYPSLDGELGANAAIAAGTIPNGALFNVSVPVSSTPPRLADQYKNVDGVATLTGQTVASGEVVDAIADALPVVERSNFWGGVIAKDKTVGIVFDRVTNNAFLGDGTNVNKALKSVSTFATLSDGISNAETGMNFIVDDGTNTPVLYSKTSTTTALRVFNIITDGQVTDVTSRSGYWTGIVGKNDEVAVVFRDSDNRAFFGNGGDIVTRIEKLEQGSGVIPSTFSDAYGNSKTAGTGGIPYPQQLAALIGGGFTANNYGIGGQVSQQIAMRMGAVNIFVTVAGDAIPSSGGTVSITTINGAAVSAAPAFPSQEARFLSTPASNNTYSLDGLLCGISVRITRTATGQNDNTKVETYTLTALSGAGARCLPGSLFVPAPAMQDLANSEVWICAGINDFRSGATTSASYDDDVSAIKRNVDAMVSFSEQQGRKIVLLGLTNDNYSVEFIGGIRYPRILELNYYWSQRYPKYYVRGNDGLDLREKMVASYNPSIPQDVTDFGNDITPSSLRSDNRHPNTAGYALYANIIQQLRVRRGY